MTYRVIQWATGGVGRAAAEGVLDHPDLELVGCWVSSAANHLPSSAGALTGHIQCGVMSLQYCAH